MPLRSWISILTPLLIGGSAFAQQAGQIRGIVLDADFEAPLPLAEVSIVEIGTKVLTSDQGNYVFNQVPAGRYTLIFAKDGYVRQAKPNVIVTAGESTDLDVPLEGDFTDMEEFVVQDILQLGGESEAALLQLRFESPALMDSISADLMSRAGASDAASALRLVSGASVQDGKFAVIRGLPDRYVSSKLNDVRLPTADEDKRAVELDQFPSPVIESIQVTKTFTPDQQGDASGGAVNVKLKGIPDETILQFRAQLGYNSQAFGEDEFLSYEGGGVDFWGNEGGLNPQAEGTSWDGAVGTSTDDAPTDFKFSLAAGGKNELDNGLTVGGFLSFFYERDSSFFDNGTSDQWWVDQPGDPMTPQRRQQTASNEYFTSLFDIVQGQRSVQWGGLGAVGVESDNHKLGLSYLYSRSASDTATLAIDTRGKEFAFPGYDPDDPFGPGNGEDDLGEAPYLRNDTIAYIERTTSSLQLAGEHVLESDDFELGSFTFQQPELSWSYAHSAARADQPDKRQFGARWEPPSDDGGDIEPPNWFQLKPDANFTLGNLQRIWQDIEEKGNQAALDLELPFEQWEGEEGYVKFGLFADRVNRTFDQDTYSNFSDPSFFPNAGFDEPWSDVFPDEVHLITAANTDVDYEGDLDVKAWYSMLDLPVTEDLTVITGIRLESTDTRTSITAEDEAQWVEPGSTQPTFLVDSDPEEYNTDFSQDNLLPALALVYQATPEITLRSSYSETIARQTFKELAPIFQAEFQGAPIFIGDPQLRMSELKNYDLRVDYRPYDGALVSVSWFHKDIKDPIEYVQRLAGFTFTTARNYPKGELTGWELEVRQLLGNFWEELDGFGVGVNATLIDSEVQLPADEIAGFSIPAIGAPMSSRDMTNAPEYLYNIFVTYDVEEKGAKLALFYTVKGDTLVEGAGQANNNFVPSVYETELGTLNFSYTQRLNDDLNLAFGAKNLTDARVRRVYRSEYIGDDVTRSSRTNGREFSVGLSMSF